MPEVEPTRCVGPGAAVGGGGGVVVLDQAGRLVAIDAAGERLLAVDHLHPRPGAAWADLEEAARTWLVARREPVDAPGGARLSILRIAALDPRRHDPAPVGRAVDQGYLASVVECLDTGVFALDADLSLVLMNAALRTLHGHGGSLAGAGWPGRPEVLHTDGSPLSDDDRLVALTVRAGEVRGLRRAIRNAVTGQLRQVSVNARTVTAPDGSFAGLAFAVHDVEDACQAQRELAWLAGHDQLTGLLNRRGLSAAIDDARAQRGAPRAVLLCDVDRFKAINDRFGHAVGDEALRLVGQALSRCAGPERLVARLGGDEFAVVSWDVAAHLGRELQGAVTHLSHQHVAGPVHVTSGHAERTSQDDALETLVARADAAMYRRRRHRRRAEDRA